MNCTRRVTLLAAALAMAIPAGVTQAATISAVGTIANDAGSEISQWRTAATAKTYDADGDNVYGSDAKLFYRVLGDYGTYVQYISSETQVGPYPGYAVVDHPNDVSPDLQVRTTTSGNTGGAGNLRNMFTFAINGTPPAGGFRVGVATDGLDGAQFSPQEIRLTQTTGGTASASINVEPVRNSTLDMVFFDVEDAQVGDRYTVQGVTGAGGFATHQIVTWDPIAVPLEAGNTIKLDFSNAGDGDGGSLADWNQTTNATAAIPTGSVKRDGDGAVVNGVGISFTGGGGGFNNDGAAGNWPGTGADPYYILAADDIYYGPGALTTTFSGLDPDLVYNVRISNLIANNAGAVETFTVTDGDGTKSVSTSRGSRWAAATLEAGGTVFTNMIPDASGHINVTVANTAGGGGYYPLNAIVLEAVAPPAKTLNWVDNFDQAADFDSRWTRDIPNPGVANITLDTAGQKAHVDVTSSTNMWTSRSNAPILWTPTPTEGAFAMETHVTMSTAQNRAIAGIALYGDGAADDGELPNFGFSLDHWGSQIVRIQGHGTNNPNISVPTGGTGEAWLRLECVPSASGADQYRAFYKLHESDPWTGLYVLHRDVPNERMGLFLKTDGAKTADFTYASMQSMAAPLRVWDFESGDLSGWNVLATGVPGDNLVFTTAGNQPAALPHSGSFDDKTIQGTYWIRTWEGEQLGTGDGHTGVLETDPFVLAPEAAFRLLVGGGNHPFSGDPDQIGGNITAVNLEREVAPGDWEMLFTATGRNANYMFPVMWDASAYAGETVRLRIYDTATGVWGHIDVDDIQYTAVPEPATMALLGLAACGLGGYVRRRREA